MKFKGQCFTCKHWEGDREGVIQQLMINDDAMEIHNGWALDGGCRLSYDWCEIEVRGDATASVEVSANFGCIRWEQAR